MLIAIAFSMSVFASADEHRSKPNIVIILVDDAALMDLGSYGGEAETPNIDALAARGVLAMLSHPRDVAHRDGQSSYRRCDDP